MGNGILLSYGQSSGPVDSVGSGIGECTWLFFFSAGFNQISTNYRKKKDPSNILCVEFGWSWSRRTQGREEGTQIRPADPSHTNPYPNPVWTELRHTKRTLRSLRGFPNEPKLCCEEQTLPSARPRGWGQEDDPDPRAGRAGS